MFLLHRLNSRVHFSISRISKRFSTTRNLSFRENLENFIKVVTKPVIPSLRFEDFKKQTSPLVEDLTKVTFDQGGSFEAYILPPSMTWPFFFAGTQLNATGKNILFHRTKDTNSARQAEIIKLVNDPEITNCCVCTIGSPGIGKSAELNFFLMHFLREKNKKKILFRVEDSFYELNLQEDGGYDINEYPFPSLESLSTLFREHNWGSQENLLLLELRDVNEHPKIGKRCTIITSISTEQDSDNLSTLEKSSSFFKFLAEPHSEFEAVSQAKLLNLYLPTPLDLNHVRASHSIMPFPRDYLTNDIYTGESISVIEQQSILKNIQLEDQPKESHTFVSPYVGSNMKIPYLGKFPYFRRGDYASIFVDPSKKSRRFEFRFHPGILPSVSSDRFTKNSSSMEVCKKVVERKHVRFSKFTVDRIKEILRENNIPFTSSMDKKALFDLLPADPIA